MGTSLEDLEILQDAEIVADEIWGHVMAWDQFAKEVVGGQLARAADSIGANIAEAFGRFHFGEKLQFLYYARGSLFEAKYWLNRALKRQLMTSEQVQDYANRLTLLARRLNAFAGSVKAQRRGKSKKTNLISEVAVDYVTEFSNESSALFNEEELIWLETIPTNL